MGNYEHKPKGILMTWPTHSAKVCIMAILLFSTLAHSQTITIDQRDILYIYDGDTFFIRCQAGMKCTKNKLGIRVRDIDTPELKGKCPSETSRARAAKKATVGFLRGLDTITLDFNERRPYGRYGRLIADVIITPKSSLSSFLLQSGHARAYGTGRKSWCN